MATQDDIDRIIAAIARGTQSVRLSDGRMVVYRSVAEMREALAVLRSEMETATESSRTTYAEYSGE